MNSKRINLICFVFVIFCSFKTSYCQEFRHTSGLYSGCAANTAITEKHIWAIKANPAILPFMEHSEIGVNYCTNYKISDIMCSSINACTKGDFLSFGMSYSIFGNKYYRVSNYTLCTARKLNKNNALGISCDIERTFQEIYKATYLVFPELAYFGRFEKLSYGIHVVNPFRIISSKKKQGVSLFKTTATYQITKDSDLGILLSQDTEGNQTFAIATSYSIKNKYRFGLAYSTAETPIIVTVQIPISSFIMNYETSCNQYLGFSHTFSLLYMF